MAKKIIVIRVGQEETQIVHMEHKDVNPTVYGCVRFPTPENAVQDGMIVDMAELAVGIHRACGDKGIRTKDVIFTIASSKIASREVSIPVVKRAKIEPLVYAKVPDLFPVDTEKYVFSFVMQGELRKSEEGGNMQDVMVFAAPSELIASYYGLADAAGLNIVSLEADGNAVFQIMKRRAKNTVSMSIQINSSSTLVNVISDDRLLMQRVIPYGINVFTEVMVSDPVFQTKTEEDAYSLLKRNRVIMPRVEAENPKNNPSLAKRIEVTDNASSLLGNIARVIEYYNTKYKEQPIQEVICMGKGCAIAGIHELMTNELGIHTYTPDEIVGIRFGRVVNVNAFILQYINCFGAVFEPVNFTPGSLSQKAQKKETATGAILVFVACLLLTIVVNGFSVLQLLTVKEENSTLRSREQAMSTIQDEYDSLMAIETNRIRIDVLDKVTTTHNDGFHTLLNEIESYVPKTFKIQNITSDEEQVSISAVSTDKLLSLSALQIQLSKIPEIQNVRIDVITRTQDSLTRRKQYTYTLNFVYKPFVVEQPEQEGQDQEGTQTEEGQTEGTQDEGQSEEGEQ